MNTETTFEKTISTSFSQSTSKRMINTIEGSTSEPRFLNIFHLPNEIFKEMQKVPFRNFSVKPTNKNVKINKQLRKK